MVALQLVSIYIRTKVVNLVSFKHTLISFATSPSSQRFQTFEHCTLKWYTMDHTIF